MGQFSKLTEGFDQTKNSWVACGWRYFSRRAGRINGNNVRKWPKIGIFQGR
jgi:hypothetical protein